MQRVVLNTAIGLRGSLNLFTCQAFTIYSNCCHPIVYKTVQSMMFSNKTFSFVVVESLLHGCGESLGRKISLWRQKLGENCLQKRPARERSSCNGKFQLPNTNYLISTFGECFKFLTICEFFFLDGYKLCPPIFT